jgi:hypothetical protein
MKIDDLIVQYTTKFGAYIPVPFGVPEEDLAKVIAEHIEKGKPIPEDYDFYSDVPADADV